MIDWFTEHKNEVLAIGRIIASTAFFGWLLHLIVICDWWTWLCWVLGILIVLLWLITIVITFACYHWQTVVAPNFQRTWLSIKDAFGVTSGFDLIEAVIKKYLESIHETFFGLK